MRCVVLAALVAGCGGSSMTAVGAIAVAPTEYDSASTTQRLLADGDDLQLVQPPQGGFVVFVGARVRGLADPTVQLASKLSDAQSGAEIANDGRVVQLKQDGDAYVPDLRSYVNVSNITVCPANTSQNLYDRAATLEVTVTELKSGRAGTGHANVTLRCAAATASVCMCQCAAGFMTGQCP